MTIGAIAAAVLLCALNLLLWLRHRPPRRDADDLRFFTEERDWVMNGNYPVALQRVYRDEPSAMPDRARMQGIGYTATATRRIDAGVITEWKRTDRIDTVTAVRLFPDEKPPVFRLRAAPVVSVVFGAAIAVGLWVREHPLSTRHLIAAIAVTATTVLVPIIVAVTWRRIDGARAVAVSQLLVAAAVIVGLADEQRDEGALWWFLVAVFAILPLLLASGELLLRRRPGSA